MSDNRDFVSLATTAEKINKKDISQAKNQQSRNWRIVDDIQGEIAVLDNQVDRNTAEINRLNGENAELIKKIKNLNEQQRQILAINKQIQEQNITGYQNTQEGL